MFIEILNIYMVLTRVLCIHGLKSSNLLDFLHVSLKAEVIEVEAPLSVE